MNVSFKSIIESYLENRKTFYPFQARVERNELVAFHPSQLSNACPREVAFRYLVESEKIKEDYLDDIREEYLSPKLKMIFDIGHLNHFIIQYGYLPDIYGKENVVANTVDLSKVCVEMPVTSLYERYLIGGTLDMCLKLQDGRHYIGDIKSINTYGFNSVMKLSKEEFVKTYKDYYIQLNLYMFGAKVRRGFFFFMDKNNQSLHEIFFNYDRDAIEKPLYVAEQAKQYLANNNNVPLLNECENLTGKYKNCPYSGLCFRCKKNPLSKIIKVTK